MSYPASQLPTAECKERSPGKFLESMGQIIAQQKLDLYGIIQAPEEKGKNDVLL